MDVSRSPSPRAWIGTVFVDESRRDGVAEKDGMAQHAGQKRAIGRQTKNDGAVERGGEASRRFAACRCMGDGLAEQRIVEGTHFEAGLDRMIETDRLRRAKVNDATRPRQE